MAAAVERTISPLVAALDALARTQPDATSVVQLDRWHSYAEFARDVQALAHALTELGVGPGDVVSAQLPNWMESLVIHLAAQRIGAVLNPILTNYADREVGFILREAGAKVFVMPGIYRRRRYTDMLPCLAGDLAHVLVCQDRHATEPPPRGTIDLQSLMDRHRGRTQGAVAVDPAEDALLIYTSGTVANPKGVRHSNATLEAEVQSLIIDSGVTAGEAVFVSSQMGHISGIDFGIHLPLRTGARVCMMDLWDPGAAAQLIERERCVWSGGAPPFLRGLVDDDRAAPFDLSSMRGYRCGSADISPRLIRAAHARSVFAYRAYGSSEHPTMTGRFGTDADRAARTDGRLFEGVEVKIVNPDEPSRALPPGAVGEIWSRGPDLFLGYKDARLNAAVFGPGGWFRSGDLGTLDADGFLTVAGRIKDIIIRKGENISAKQIEDLISEHPAVAQVAVIGLPDEESGERVCAVVLPREAQRPDLETINAWLEQRGIARYKLPTQLELVQSMPVNETGKIKKKELRATLSGGTA